MLQINIINQFYIFLISINYGLILGVIYDLYRVFRYYSKPKKILTAIEDILFWLIIASIIFFFLFNKTDGIIRGFVILGFIIGFIIYLKIISKYSYFILKKTFGLIFRIINEIIIIISFPFKKASKIFGKKANKIAKLFRGTLKENLKYLKITKRKI